MPRPRTAALTLSGTALAGLVALAVVEATAPAATAASSQTLAVTAADRAVETAEGGRVDAAVAAAAAQREAEARAAAEAQAAAERAALEARAAEVRAAEERASRAARDPRSLARSMLAERGFGAAQFTCLDRLWSKESEWRWNADNPTSSAYGIPQALPGSKMASAGADWRTNPATQIEWGLGYIAEVYGTPCAAWQHSQARNWY